MSDNDSSYSQYDEDSVPPPEKEIKHTHPGRPDLDYDETPVGPAEAGEFENNETAKESPEEDGE